LGLISPFGLLNAAPAQIVSKGSMRTTGDVAVASGEMSNHLNSFAMIFGRCVWIPPSPMAALAALRLFYGVGIGSGADAAGYEAAIASQYVSSGKTEAEAQQEIVALNACFGTYEVPPEHRSERGTAKTRH
ncbi:MAG TPA: hypothetical protein VHG31_06180, partial [Stellaceae bacterium]|nr:hypothetical protein [Stellaceae bacterium]